MSNNLVSKLSPWVTTFSEGIRYKCQHKDELLVGGKIVRIFDLAKILSDEEAMVYITLDDDVGQMALVMPSKIYQECNSKYSFCEGMIVLAKGRLLDPDNSLKKPTILKKFETIEAPPLVPLVCWNLEPYKEKEILEQI